MRKKLLSIVAVGGLAAGCAGPGGTGSSGGFGGWAQSTPKNSYGPAVQQASWTDRVMAPFGGGSATTVAANQPSPDELARRQALDPISLNFKGSTSETPQLYVAMAEMSQRGGNVSQARQLYQKALAIDPKYVPGLLSAARMEDRAGEMNTAAGLYQRAVAIQPDNPTALNDLALCLARKGEFAEAHRALERVVQLEPRKPLYRNNIAKILIEMNRQDEAAWHLATVHPPAVVNYNMGVLLYQRGRTHEAGPYLARALQLNPAMQPARAILAQISAPAAAVAARPTTPAPAPATAEPVTPTLADPASQTPSTTGEQDVAMPSTLGAAKPVQPTARVAQGPAPLPTVR